MRPSYQILNIFYVNYVIVSTVDKNTNDDDFIRLYLLSKNTDFLRSKILHQNILAESDVTTNPPASVWNVETSSHFRAHIIAPEHFLCDKSGWLCIWAKEISICNNQTQGQPPAAAQQVAAVHYTRDNDTLIMSHSTQAYTQYN